MSQIANFDIRGCITEALTDTFRTMLSREIEPAETDPPADDGGHRMAGTLNFAGAVNGIFNIQVGLALGRELAAGMREPEPEAAAPTAEVRDLLAEITNIVGGSLKSALTSAGYPCILSTPSITCGTDFSIRCLGMEHFERFVFRLSAHALIVEVGLKAVAGAETATDLSSPEALRRLPDVDLARLAALDYRAKVSAAAADVFDTMFSLRLEAVKTVAAESLGRPRNVSSVCFAGDATGIVSIHVGETLSRTMAARMLDLEPEEIEGQGEVQDLLGELGNIVGGNIKSALTDTGLRCALSTPSITTGSDFMTEALDLEHHERCAFTCEGQPVVVELGVKISDLVMAAAGGGAAQTSPMPQPEAAAPDDPAQTMGARPASIEELGLEILLDIPVELTVELGRTRMPIQELLRLTPGSAVKLANLEGEPVDILANDVLIARGEVVVNREKYGIRITEITSRLDRLKGLR
jgi:flagellar motor switch protein FliN